MTQGINAIAKAVEQRNSADFRRINASYLVGAQEQTLHTFVNNHMMRYGLFPTPDVLQTNGIILPAVPQPFDYYFDELTKRFILTHVRDNFDSVVQGLQQSNVEAVRTFVQETSRIIALPTHGVRLSSFHDEANIVMDRAERTLVNPLSMQGITTGYSCLDMSHGGLEGGGVTVLAGRPNTGKSFYLLNMAHAAWQAGTPVLLVSLEMSNRQMATRLLSIYSRMNPRYFQHGQIATQGRNRLNNLISTAATDKPPFFFMSGDMRKSLDDVKAAIDMVNPGVVYIDSAYLLKVDTGSKYTLSRRDNVSAMVEELKAHMMHTDKHAVITTQFNRSAEATKGSTKRGPAEELDLSMIADSDTVGQVASIILGIPPAKGLQNADRRVIQVLKDREGPVYKFLTNFRTEDPVDFSFIEIVQETADEGTRQAAQAEQVRQRLEGLGYMV